MALVFALSMVGFVVPHEVVYTPVCDFYSAVRMMRLFYRVRDLVTKEREPPE